MGATICLPFPEANFREVSVDFAGARWVERYLTLTRSPGVTLREMPPVDASGMDPYERCNRWMVYLALATGAREVRGLVVWDGKHGDGPGGSEYMSALLTEFGIPVEVITPSA
jgi:hypothetical protein